MTEKLWSFFEQISTIPRGSGNEQQIRSFLSDFAKKLSLAYKTDNAGNLIIQKPGTKGREHEQPVVIQGHMDMVCEKNESVIHDFSKDPIQLKEESGWITAEGTTLGADNGIAIAMVMELLDTDEVSHPPLEILITVDEESGMNGALGIEPSVLSGRRLINLDSEEEGIFYIGCAGGIHTNGEIPVNRGPKLSSGSAMLCSVKGLKGGHSGMEIDKGLGNAIVLMGEFLSEYDSKLHIVSLKGGDKHNAIPRECICSIIVDDPEKLKSIALRMTDEYKKRFPNEPDVRVSIESHQPDSDPLTEEDTVVIITFLKEVPHGPLTMDKNIPGLVESSTNFAAVILEEECLKVVTSQRWSDPSLQEYVTGLVKAAVLAAGGKVSRNSAYPPWKPNPESPLLKKAVETYRSSVHAEPEITVVHAGLECGVISEKIPDMDMISFGPDITGAHSPDERVNIESTERVRKFLIELLKSL